MSKIIEHSIFISKKKFPIKIQLNKNLGICDIFFPEKKKPFYPDNKIKLKRYDALLEEYEKYQELTKNMRSCILNTVQGRPFEYGIDSIEYLINIFMR